MATSTATTATISPRTRNLGIGSNTSPRDVRNPETGRSTWTIDPPTSPDVAGGLRTVEAEYAHIGRQLGTAERHVALFVGGRRIVGVADWGGYLPAHGGKIAYGVLEALRRGNTLIVELAAE